MAYDSNKQAAGKLVFDQSVIERDALIREDNDGEVIRDTEIMRFVRKNGDAIGKVQDDFFATLLVKSGLKE